jgi:hypothetical protein
MNGHRVLRLLRVSMLVTSGILCCLLVALWVRSYYYLDQFSWPLSTTRGIEFVSLQGKVRCSTLRLLPAYFQLSAWGLESMGSGSWPAKDEIEESKWGSTFVSPLDFSMWMPYSALVLVGMAVAVAPWIKWRRFSVRSMLVAVTLVAILLGVVMASW